MALSGFLKMTFSASRPLAGLVSNPAHASFILLLRNETCSSRCAVGDGRCPNYEVAAGWDSVDVAIERASVDCFFKCGLVTRH